MKYQIEAAVAAYDAQDLLNLFPQLNDFEITIEREEKDKGTALYRVISKAFIELDTLEDLNRLIDALHYNVILEKAYEGYKIKIHNGCKLPTT